MTTAKPERNFAIDWLRVFAMLMVFLFHCGRFFDEDWWHVKNDQLDFGITIFVLFLSQWIPKYALLSTASFCVIMVLYEILVRRINILRYLFGLKIDRNAAGKRHI